MNERLPKFKGEKLLAEIEKSTAGLTYVSETDAPVEPYMNGRAKAVEASNLTDQTRYEEMSAPDFFARLTADKDWYGERERNRSKRFASLYKLLQENLQDLKVFKVGRVQLDIYVVGLDADGNLIGLKTKAVET